MRRIAVQLGAATLVLEESQGGYFLCANLGGMTFGMPAVPVSGLVNLIVELAQLPDVRAALEVVRNALDVPEPA